MRTYLFGSGIIGAATSGLSLLRNLRGNEPFTWRTALAWLSWGITLALAIGAIVDARRESRGEAVPSDSGSYAKQQKQLRKASKALTSDH